MSGGGSLPHPARRTPGWVVLSHFRFELTPSGFFLSPGRNFLNPSGFFLSPGRNLLNPSSFFLLPGRNFPNPSRLFLSPGRNFLSPSGYATGCPADISVSGMSAVSLQLDGLNQIVAGREQALAAARAPRKADYDGEGGLKEKMLAIKEAVKSQYGSQSPEFLQVKGIRV